MDVIQFKDVGEMYRIKFITEGKTSWENFWALKDISFKAEKGETIGIIGENGAGKSTILKLIMDMLRPDKGEIEVKGRVSGLLELGAGFQPELTGRENVYLNAGLFGLTRSEIEAKYEEIANFASLGKFINAPAKCYSQGMFVRLAFSVAIHADPDILLIDDTLSVGDEHFQRKCIKKVFELKEQGKTIVFVTHDMNMLSRLCKRAIFLKDGRIVKDGPIDKVIPLYTQMVGSKEGVGILEKGPLNLVFNNGRLLINWKDKIITPNSGAYTSFLVSDKWYSSLQADWQVKRDGENKLLATGNFYQIALTEIWRLELTDDYGVKWDIEMDSQEPVEMKEGFINIMLTNEYDNWFTTLEEGGFPFIDYKDKKWQHLLDANIFRKCMGVKAKETLDTQIPSLIFEQSNYEPAVYTQILNSDYITNCRVLQYKKLGLQNYSANHADRFIYFSGKITLDIPDIDNYLTNLEDEFILSNGKLRLTFDNGRCVLGYDGMTLTKSEHISTSVYVNGKWYSSNLAHWDIKKQGKDKIIITGTWPSLPLIQVWEIELTGENCFLWKVNMRLNEELCIEQQHCYVMGCKDYTQWFSKYGAGKFPDGFLETEMDMDQKCIPDGEIGLMSQNVQLPTLSIKFSNKFHNFAKIFNSDFYNKARTLRIEKVEPEEDIKFPAGQYPCFKLNIALNKDKRICVDNFNILQDKKLKFVFDNGKGRIFWNEKELTKRLGLYTSLRSQGRWYDSASSALWKIEEGDDNTIKTYGKWLRLPISQFWKIKLLEDRIIECNVKMKVDKEIEIDRLQTNLMVSERYSQWLTNRQRGSFPLFKEDVNDDWDCVWSGRDGIEYIGVLANLVNKSSLPILKFYPFPMSSNLSPNIVNSDIYHRGRVLQYLDANKKMLPRADYLYFNGKIIIG